MTEAYIKKLAYSTLTIDQLEKLVVNIIKFEGFEKEWGK